MAYFTEQEYKEYWEERGFSFDVGKVSAEREVLEAVHEDKDEIIVVVDGELEFTAHGETFKPLIDEEIIIPANVVHSIKSPSGEESKIYYGYKDTNERFDHNYGSCSRTYASLLFRHESLHPDEVTEALILVPDDIIAVGDKIRKNSDKVAQMSQWRYSTSEEGEVFLSKDLSYHIEWLLQELDDEEEAVKMLLEKGYTITISCFWQARIKDLPFCSSWIDGGPLFDSKTIKWLSKYPIDLDLDIYNDAEIKDPEDL